MKPGLSGYVCVRQAVELDYCIEEAAESLLPVVDELILCDGESTDGTLDILNWLKAKHPQKVRIENYPWPGPHRNIHWWVDWLNFARGHCRFPMSVTLDADEVLDPCSYDSIRQIAHKGGSALFKRYNYWKDTNHLVPFNKCCGEQVARLAPTTLWMCSDEPNPRHHPNARTNAESHPDLIIHHLGFLRKNDAFVKKTSVVQNAFFGQVDDRIAKATEGGKHWTEFDYFSGEALRPAERRTPTLCHAWLAARGYAP